MGGKLMSKELSLQELQGLAQELHDMEEGFEIEFKENDFDTLLAAITSIAGELQDTDECNLSDEAKAVLHGLGLKLPWDEEEVEELKLGESDNVEDDEIEGEEESSEEEIAEDDSEADQGTECAVGEVEIEEAEVTEPEPEVAPKPKTKKEKVVVKKKIKDNGPVITSKSEKDVLRESMKEVEAVETAKKAKAAAKPVAKKVTKVKEEKGPRYTRISAFADAIREGGKDDAELIKKANQFYKKNAGGAFNDKVAGTVHTYCMGALQALNLVKEKNGKLTI